jgi:hypothetical protein
MGITKRLAISILLCALALQAAQQHAHRSGSDSASEPALALEVGSVVTDGILFFVPAKVGTQEGGKVLLFAMLGLDPARGLTVGVVRRIRELTYAGLGLAILAWLTTRRMAEAPGAGSRATLSARGGRHG